MGWTDSFQVSRSATFQIPAATAADVVVAAMEGAGMTVQEVDRWSGTITGGKARLNGTVVLLIATIKAVGNGTTVQMNWSQAHARKQLKSDADLQQCLRSFEAGLNAVVARIQQGPAW